jgi:hypothetical protein
VIYNHDSALFSFRGVTIMKKKVTDPNSRKSKVRACFDAKGREAAFSLGEKLGLKKGTTRTWCATWQREKPVKAKAKAKVKPKAAADGDATDTTVA